MLQNIQQIRQTVVKRVAERGTAVVIEPFKAQYWTGNEFKKQEYSRLKRAHNPMLLAARGTRSVRASDFMETKTPDPTGHYIITGRGTGRIRL
jgi:hypothetical protein